MTKYYMSLRFIVPKLRNRDVGNLTTGNRCIRQDRHTCLLLKVHSRKMQYLLILIHDEEYTCWTRNKEKSNVIADIFCTHPYFLKLLNMFHLILIPFIRIKGDRTWTILSVVRHMFPSGDARKMRDYPSRKIV